MPEVTPPSVHSPIGKPAFTLLELLIVILLMSVMALLIVGMFSRGKRENKAPGIPQIREWADPVPSEGTELVCIDNCARCFFRRNGGKMEETSLALPPLQAYTVGRYSQAERVRFGRYRDHPVCLRFRYHPDGSTSRLILKSGEKFYYVPAFFGRVESFSSLDEAVDRWQEGNDLLRNRWDYY